jgi:hypothetical protein
MSDLSDYQICRHIFDAQNIIDAHPPKIKNTNKKIVYQIACPPNSIQNGRLTFARWRTMPLPSIDLDLNYQTIFEERSSYFEYEPLSENNNQVEWYLNFSHADLFCAYGFAVFAQDEIQVAEHPVLASLREALLSAKIEPLTVERGMPTPITIRNVERRCSISTDINPDRERPVGLYGNNFAKATAKAIELATTSIDPPTITNIIAMEAPAGGYGSYQYDEIEYVLTTAFTGFSAAKIESQLECEEPITIIHTGFWGCGAYGGNRVLMALLQLLAARLAKIDRLIFHTGDSIGSPALTKAHQILDREFTIGTSNLEIADLLTKIEAKKFHWGVGDGN